MDDDNKLATENIPDVPQENSAGLEERQHSGFDWIQQRIVNSSISDQHHGVQTAQPQNVKLGFKLFFEFVWLMSVLLTQIFGST